MREAKGSADRETHRLDEFSTRRVLVLVAKDIDNPSRAGGDRHVCLLAEFLARRGAAVTILCSSRKGLPKISRRNGTRIQRIAPLRALSLSIWARLAGGAGLRADLVVEDMIGAARAPFLAPLFPSRAVLGFWFQDNTGFFRTHYPVPVAALAGTVQRLVLATHVGTFIVCPSRASRDWLVSRGFPAERVGVFYPSADPDNLSQSSLEFSERANRFVSIGNIRRVKRFQEAIATLRLVRARIPDAELAIVGRREDDGYLAELRRFAIQEGVGDAVVFELDISDEQKYRLLANSKVLSIHSAVEGFALTVTEAGLCGVPAVVNSSVPPEAFLPGESGIRTQTDTAEAFAEEISRLFLDEGRWRELSRRTQELSRTFKEARPDEVLSSILDRLGM